MIRIFYQNFVAKLRNLTEIFFQNYSMNFLLIRIYILMFTISDDEGLLPLSTRILSQSNI